MSVTACDVVSVEFKALCEPSRRLLPYSTSESEGISVVHMIVTPVSPIESVPAPEILGMTDDAPEFSDVETLMWGVVFGVDVAFEVETDALVVNVWPHESAALPARSVAWIQ